MGGGGGVRRCEVWTDLNECVDVLFERQAKCACVCIFVCMYVLDLSVQWLIGERCGVFIHDTVYSHATS